MKKQLIKNKSTLKRALEVKKLKNKVLWLQDCICKKDTAIHRRDCQIAKLKLQLEESSLTFRERIFWRKKKKADSPVVVNHSLRGMQDQVSATIKSWKYSDDDMAELFGTTKRNVRRFIKRNGLR